MADKPKNPVAAPAHAGSAGDAPQWRSVWQAPALIVAVLLLVGGIVTALVTRPKPDASPLFKQAAAMIEREEYKPALDLLNGKIRAFYDGRAVTPEQAGLFHLYRARAVYLGERQAGVSHTENARSVVEEYAEAARAGAALEPRDTAFLADANIVLGKYERALELAGGLPATDREARARIFRKVVEARLAGPAVEKDAALRLLVDYLKEADLSVADRAWGLARQAEILLKQGQTAAAITRLLQGMPGVVAAGKPEAVGELYLLLGRAYLETGAAADAGRQLEQAASLLLDTDPRRGEAMVLLGRVDELTKQPPEEARAEAKQKYEAVAERFVGAAVRLPALLGLGEVEAAIGDTEASLKAYSELAQELALGKRHPDAALERVKSSLLERSAARTDVSDLAGALRYAEIAEGLYQRDSMPADVLLRLARSHRGLAERLLQGVGGGEGPAGRTQDLAQLDPATREQVRMHLLAAGRYFKRHADRVGVEDNAGFGGSMWLAADSFDLAGDPEQAIPVFADYVKFFPADTRQPEARYRLGQAHQAKGDYVVAAEYYRGLVADAGKPGQPVGPYGDISRVPLARTLLLDSEPGNDAEAEALLERVVQGLVGGTSTPQFRDGLVELGMLKRRRGDYTGAIEQLQEAVKRFPADPKIDEMKYDLADSCRQDARAIARTLQDEMPAQRRQGLEEARVGRLRRAQELFEEVRAALEAKDPRRMSALDQVRLRNASFYLGDCAFDLADYETAIRQYDAAREKYPKDPASLVAMIQIVNAYLEQGDLKRARTANDRAKRFYESLPESAWTDPNLPIGQAEWQRWLDAMGRLMPATAGVEGGAPAEAPK